MSRTSADQRYSDLLDQISDTCGRDLVFELDQIIGERMAHYGDVAVAATPLGVLQASIDALRAELADLRNELATEVRTRRLVVVGEDGFERITTEARHDYGSVQVNSKREVHIALIADEMEGDASAQLFLSGGGNGAGNFVVVEESEGDAIEYLTSIVITPDPRDPRFHEVSLDRNGLSLSG